MEMPTNIHDSLDYSLSESQTCIQRVCVILLVILVLVNCYYYSSILFVRNNMVITVGNITDRSGYFQESTTLSYMTNRQLMEQYSEPERDLIRQKQKMLQPCFLNMTGFGERVTKVTNSSNIQWVDKLFPEVHFGGYYSPPNCQARHKIIILVTFRNRYQNLVIFMLNMHPFLMKQQLDYRILVIEQFDKYLFNQGRLYNAGFLESQRFGDYQCIIFHDIDLMPIDERILYTCPLLPRHMASSVINPKYKRPYLSMFGGVSAMTPEQFRKVNGYSNLYWGWGGEDDDLFWRIRSAGYQVVRYNKTIARYLTIPYGPSTRRRRNDLRYYILKTAKRRRRDEGLSTIKYRVISITKHHLYTHIQVDVNPKKENPEDVKLYLQRYL